MNKRHAQLANVDRCTGVAEHERTLRKWLVTAAMILVPNLFVMLKEDALHRRTLTNEGVVRAFEETLL